jgi:hypothetical protein
MSGRNRWVGFYVPGAPASMTPIGNVESLTGAKCSVVCYYQSVKEAFPGTRAQAVIDHGSVPLVTLEFWDSEKGSDQPEYSLKAIANGSQDDRLREHAKQAKAFGQTVWLRPLHEMNGDWDYPWSGNLNGNTPTDFVPAWRHVRDIFTQEGAANVKFVWCPNAESVPFPTADNHNAISTYWPGSDYVDYVALDGYNAGNTSSVSSWRDFSAVFGAAYGQVKGYGKPILLGEVSSVEQGGDKALWIRDMFAAIPRDYPKIVGVCWFDAQRIQDWRVESSSASLQAFRAGISDGVYSGTKPVLTKTSVSIRATRPVTTRRRGAELSGRIGPGQRGDHVSVYVKRPGSSAWKLASTRFASADAAWSIRLPTTRRGAYYCQARYKGDPTRAASTSRAVRILVR